jgi:poly-gamma-glutamate synthesis protein (capsule biosynthesis protein)
MVPTARLIILLTLTVICVCPATAEPLRIAAVGDIMLAGRYDPILRRQGIDYPFAATVNQLRWADLAIGNLEAPLTTGGTEYRDKRFRFRAAPAMAGTLRRAGFSVLTLANNHILDYGAAGLVDTLDILKREQLAATGAGTTLSEARTPAILTRAGRRIAVLAYSLTQPVAFFAGTSHAGTAPAYGRHVTADIRRARQQADLVIVAFHWGGELETTPRPVQRDLARAAIDAGATVVLGHHPHVLQGIEFHGDGVICYSLGNFTFGSGSRSATTGMIAQITIPDSGPPEVEVVPLSVDNRKTAYQPQPLTGAAATQAIATINRLSRPLGTRILTADDRHRATANGATHAATLFRPDAAR